MTLRHIEIFLAVRQCGSVTGAADRLHISQPTVSIALRELEEHYGERLFDRISNRLYITPFGDEIYHYALCLMNLYSDMSQLKQRSDLLRIGTGTAIGKLFLPGVVKRFGDLHPEVRIHVCVGEATRMYRRIMDNSLDLAIAETVDNIPGMAHHSIQRYPVVATCHRSNPLAAQPVVTAEELSRENLLLREPGSLTRDVVDAYFDSHNLQLEPVWESYSVQSLFNATVEGLGVSFMSLDQVLAYGNPNLVILHVPDFQAFRYVNISYHKDKQFSKPMQDFLTYYTASTRQQLQAGLLAYKTRNPSTPYSEADISWQP